MYDADDDGFLSKQEVIRYAEGNCDQSNKQPCNSTLLIFRDFQCSIEGEFTFTPPESCIAPCRIGKTMPERFNRMTCAHGDKPPSGMVTSMHCLGSYTENLET